MNGGNGVVDQASSTNQNSINPNFPFNSQILPDHYSKLAIAGSNSLLNLSIKHNNKANTISSTNMKFSA